MTRYFRPAEPGQLPEAAGFRSEAQSVHGSRTIMLADLTRLLSDVPANAPHEAYERAILSDNVLGKRTASTRLWSFKKLRELYALDPAVPLFAELRRFWDKGAEGRPLLALLAGLGRDALLRASVPAITASQPGDEVTKDQFQDAIVAARGERFRDSTMQAILSHLISSWTESGHLEGRQPKRRKAVFPTPAAVAYALSLGFMAGARGGFLFSSLWTSVLDTPAQALHEHAKEASRRGWLTYRGVGDVVDVSFPQLAGALSEVV